MSNTYLMIEDLAECYDGSVGKASELDSWAMWFMVFTPGRRLLDSFVKAKKALESFPTKKDSVIKEYIEKFRGRIGTLANHYKTRRN